MTQIVRPYRSSGGYTYGHFHGLCDSNTTICGKEIDGNWMVMIDGSEMTCEKCIKKYNKSGLDKVKQVEAIIGLSHDRWGEADPIELIKACHKIWKK